MISQESDSSLLEDVKKVIVSTNNDVHGCRTFIVPERLAFYILNELQLLEKALKDV